MSHIDELKWKTIKAGKMKSLLVERICEMNIGLSFLNRPQIDLCFRYWSGRRVIDGCNIDVTASAAGMYGGAVLLLIELAWASGSMSVNRVVYPLFEMAQSSLALTRFHRGGVSCFSIRMYVPRWRAKGDNVR